MTTDFVQPVAKAYGEGSPEIHSIAKRQDRAIDDEIGRLRIQASAIRQLVALAPPPPPPPVAVQAEDTAQAAEAATTEVATRSNGLPPPFLTEDQKQLARELWESERRSGHDLSSQDVVDLMRGRGVVFGVQQPAAAIGMTLASVRRAWTTAHPDEDQGR